MNLEITHNYLGGTMTLSQFVGATLWTSIIVIIFGVLFKFIDNNLTTWAMFIFLNIVGFFKLAFEWRH